MSTIYFKTQNVVYSDHDYLIISLFDIRFDQLLRSLVVFHKRSDDKETK